ncbi:MAG: VWA domain-containing protein [Deltaproteobacteria bacterium]|nr:VWA domain-containing protein [Deltaproteobacteria bacterium]
MRLAEPWALFALILVPAVLLSWWAFERRRARIMARAGDPELLARMSGDPQDRGRAVRMVQAILLAAAMALVAGALARPQFGLRTEVRKARGMDVVVALDLSRSMLARDVVPSRLQRARVELEDLLQQIPGDRVGLVGFTSVAIPLCPLTIDHAAVKLQLGAANPGDMPRGGTAIGDAIREGMKMLQAAKDTGGAQAIVVVTDGEEHEGDPEAAAKAAHEAGIEVHVVGVGSRTGEPIPLVDDNGKVTGYVKDAQGQTVVSRLDEDTLRKISTAGGGLVALPGAHGGLDLGPVRAHLATLKKAELSDRVVRVYEERYAWFLVPAFALLLLATLIRPSRRAGVLVALLLMAARPAAAAGPLEAEDPDARAGRQALSEGKGEEAVKAYEKALDRLGQRPELLYDLGLAEQSRGEVDKAIDRFKQAQGAATDPKVRGQAAYALGNAYRGLKKYDEAMAAYRQALLDDPTQSGARRNLELTRAMKAVQAAQPKQENPDGEQNPDDQPPEGQDGGVNDAGDRDGGPQDQDGGPQDGGVGDGGGESGEDGGAGQDGGSSNPDQQDGGSQDGGGEGKNDAGGGGGQDAGSSGGEDGGGQDGGAAPQAAPQQDEPQEALDQQDVDQLLDSLQEQEKALERKRLLKKYKGKAVKKDW